MEVPRALSIHVYESTSSVCKYSKIQNASTSTSTDPNNSHSSPYLILASIIFKLFSISKLFKFLVIMSEKKRKRGEESRNERPNKKVATVATADNVQVSVVQDIGEWPPIIGGRIPFKAER